MTDLTLLASRTRTPTSAFVVSMWYIPGGHDYGNASPIAGFFQTQEEEEAKALVSRNADIPTMAVLTPIADHDMAVARSIKVMEHRIESLEAFDPNSPLLAKERRDLGALKSRNLM